MEMKTEISESAKVIQGVTIVLRIRSVNTTRSTGRKQETV